MKLDILEGDCLAVLPTLAADSVQCCVTSPPYWGLRDYGVSGQLGMEPTYQEHIAALVAVFREVRRVLRSDGTLWLNYGDCYATAPNGRSAADTKAAGNDDRTFRDKPFSTVGGSLKPKDLAMLPARVAIALQEDGWWVRSEIIWAKPNPMPESCTDRPTSSHEKIYLLTKRAKYFYDAEAVREIEAVPDWDNGTRVFGGKNKHGANAKHGDRTTGRLATARVKVPGGWDRGDGAHGTIHREGRTEAEYQDVDVKGGRNLRNVWTIATSPFPEAHFATFPPELAERCIKAGTSERGCCPTCGAPWRRVVERGEPDAEWQRRCGADASGAYDGQSTKGHDSAGVQNASDVKRRILAGLGTKRQNGWAPTCCCPPADPVPCVVLDPFAGAGTTLAVARELGRSAIGIELNPEYVAMAWRRLQAASPFERISPLPDLPAGPLFEGVI